MGVLAITLLLVAGTATAKEHHHVTKIGTTVGAVTSVGSQGGATAGVIQNLQQNYVLPTLVRGPLLNDFKRRFTLGSIIFQKLQRSDLTDEQYKDTFDQADAWYSDTYSWLNKQVDAWAAERFAFRFGSAMTWDLPNRSTELNTKRTNYINVLYPVLQNLDQLMREPSIYPSETQK